MYKEHTFRWVAQQGGEKMGAAVQLEEPLMRVVNLEGYITVIACPNGKTIIDKKAKKR